MENLVETITGIPALEHLNTSALPSLEDAADLFQKKCEKNGGPEAFDRANKGREAIMECFKNLINTTELQKEMEIARPHGELDTVFKKYCGRTPIMKQCVEQFIQSFEPCLEQKEQENVKIVMNITDALLGFVCFKEGDRIALFISAQGPECFQQKQNDLQECLNNTFGSYAPVASLTDAGGLSDIKTLPSLLFGLKECQHIEQLQRCSVRKLEACSDPTPGNIVDSLFDFIKKSTPCDNLLKEAKVAARISDVSSSQTFHASLFTTTIVLLFLRIV